MNNNKSGIEIISLALGELIVSALIIAGYLIADVTAIYPFTYKVITGVLLGSLVTVGNFFFLSVSVNRAIDSYVAARGTREMTDEEAEQFTNEHSMGIQNAIKASFIVRTVTMLLTLVLAFIAGVFEPLATVIPLLMYRPIITLTNLFCQKKAAKSEDDAMPISHNEITEKEDQQ